MADEKVKDGQAQETTGAEENEETKGGVDQSTETTGGSADSGVDEGKQQPKTFTQEQVNKMMAREKNQGRAAALKELGIDPKDAKAVAMVKAIFASQRSNDEGSNVENEKVSEAERRALVAEAKAEAMMVGVQPQYVDDVVALALAKIGDDETADLKSVIGEYKTKYPMWFKVEDDKGSGDAGKKTGQKGTGSSIKSNAGSNKDKDGGKGLGARLAAQRKSTIKSSYWGVTKR